jgi:acetolactate synthase-1/2/3 large subunit
MGDCSFGMSGMDIETASRNGIAILTVVFNNGVMACERHVLEAATEKFGALSVGGNYSKVAEGLNVESRRVEKPADIVSAIKAGLDANARNRPFLIEIMAKEGYDFSRYTKR